MPHVVAIANQKGGVGKTTTAINLAASVAATEREVLVVDIDPQGNATSGLGIARQGEEPDLYDALLGEQSIESVIRGTDMPHLYLAPASPDLTGAEIELVSMENREQRLRQVIEPLGDRFDHIFVDCPPSLGLLTLNALCAADSLLVPLQCEYYALEGLSYLLSTVERVRKRLNPQLALGGIVLCMWDPRQNLTHQVTAEVRGHFDAQVYDTVIPRNVRLSEAPSHGKPVLLYDVDSRGCQSYLRLAEEYLGRAGRQKGGAP